MEAGCETWILRTLSCHLGLRLDQPAAVSASMPRLARLLDGANPAQRETARKLLDPFLPRDVIRAFRDGNNALVCGYERLWALLDPQSHERFVLPPPGRTPDLARFRNPGDDARLCRNDLPPAGAGRIARTAVLAARRYWAPSDPNSREHDIPARIAAAIDSYGWRSIRCDIRSFVDPAIVTEDYRAIAAACRDSRADVLIIDEFQPARGNHAAPGEILRALKREQPQLRIIGLYLDPWLPEQWNDIAAAAELVDGLWSPVGTELWRRPAFGGKALFIPLPHGGVYRAPAHLQPGFGFHGGVQYSNWDRAFWFAAIAELGLPVEGSISGHRGDELAPLESYRAYMDRMSAHEAVLNFSRRSNGTHTLTARTFEVPAAGGLLVQERSDDIDRFFVAGRHYLRFETLTDLADISHLIRTEPDFVESIRREGAAFFRERYADDRIIAYLDHFLFHRSAARAA
ncbi:MAG TPA: glycosyltransferase [Stellaceae bacterium]